MAKLEDVILRDTRASQPLASDVAVGTLYYVTDELVTERSNGVTWDDFSDAGGGGGGDVATDTIWNALGDLAAGTGANTAAVLTVGTDGQVLTADSGEATGLIWTTIAGGGDALVANTLDQFADVTQTAGKTLAITENTTLAGGSHSGTNTGDQTSVSGNAGTVTVADAGGDTTTWPLLGTAQTGSLAPATDAGLTYNATSNALTATTFVGAVTGDVTGNVSGSSGSCTGNAATASTATTVSDAAITLAKMANLAQDQFIGRTTASTGVPETATITAAARTVLDDTTVGAMVDTLGGASAVGTGGLARATSPVFVTPLLGTPTSGVLTNCTGTASGLTAGNVTTNANLTGPVTSTGNATAIADGALALAKLANGTAGNVVAYNASGVIAAVATGTATHVLTSNGAGAAPTFQAAAGGGGDNVSVNGTSATDADFDDATPAAVAGGTNVKWQKDSGTPNNISAYLDMGTIAEAFRRKPFYANDFENYGEYHPFTGATINSGSYEPVTTNDASHPGAHLLKSHASSADSGIRFQNSVNWAQNIRLAGGECIEMVCYFTDTTNLTLYFGFVDTASVTAPTYGAWINVAGTTASGKTADAGTSTTGNSHTISAATWYRFKVEVNSGATQVDFTIYNDSGSSLWTNNLTTNIPTASNHTVKFGVVATNSAPGGAAKSLLTLDYMAFWLATRALTR